MLMLRTQRNLIILQKKMKKIVLLPFLSFTLLVASCKKKDDIPDVSVDVYLNLQLPDYIWLQTPLNHIYYNAGNHGLIIYRKAGNDFSVLERTCTFDPQRSTAIVEVMNDNFTCVDSTCGSKFSINDGAVINGPATQTLRQYRYDFDGTTLHIYN
jgi:nitrite reductase/ring-hydroxylating ferredoxin subunit